LQNVNIVGLVIVDFVIILRAVNCNTLNLGLNLDYNVKGISNSEIKLKLSVAAYGP
jgi:hypothetical protein